VVIAVAAVEYGVIPFVVRTRSEISVLDQVAWPLLVVAVLAEIASLAAYTRLTQTLLDPSDRLRFAIQWRIDVTGYGLSHAVPGGGATAAGLRVGLMVDRDIAASTALALTVVQLALSVIGLMMVWLLGLLMVVPHTGFTATTVALLLTTSVVLAALEAAPHQAGVPPALRRLGSTTVHALVPRRWREAVHDALVSGARWLREPRVTRRGVAWGGANWLLDAVCLWLCLRAFGAAVPVELVLATYGLVNMVAMLPLTPGGIGIVEGLLIPAMAAAGAPAGAALAGVLTWRLLQFWLPIPAGALCWTTLVAHRHRGGSVSGGPVHEDVGDDR